MRILALLNLSTAVIVFFVAAVDQNPGYSQSVKTIATAANAEKMLPVSNGKFLYLSNSNSTSVLVVDTRTDSITRTIELASKPLAITIAGKFVAAATADKSIKLINTSDHTIIAGKQIPYIVNRLQSAPTGDYLYGLASDAGKILQIIVPELRIMQELNCPANASDIAVSNNKLYISYFDDNKVSVLNMKSVKISDDEMAGLPEILVRFEAGVQESQIVAMMSESGLEQIKVIKALNIRVFRVRSSKPIKEIIAACEQQPFVKYAEVNQTYKTQK